MPIMNGLELFVKLKEQNCDIPFIIFTGHSREELAIEALNLGVDYYITKGSDAKSQYKELIHVIKTAVKHKKAENKLRRSEEMIRTVINNIPQVIFWKNRDSEYLGCNNKFAEISGVGTPDMIIGKTDFDLAWKENESYTCRESDIAVMETDTPKYNVLEDLRQSDGSVAWFDTNKIPLHNEKAEVIGVVGTYENITKRKEIQDILLNQKEELSEFVSIMNHDLCNSLTTMKGYIDIFKEEKDEIYLNKIVKIISSSRRLLNNSAILAEAGLVLEERNVVDLNQLIEEVADITIPSTINFKHDNLSVCSCDREKTIQIFKNLFENAVMHGRPTKIYVKQEESKDEYILKIINDGKRIPIDKIDRISEQLCSTKKGKRGLGLIIVKKIVEAHKWKIDVHSDKEETVFQIRIPIENS